MDVNECTEGLADCEQQCINKDPRRSGVPFSCACSIGYSLDLEDRTQCVKTVSTADALTARLAQSDRACNACHHDQLLCYNIWAEGSPLFSVSCTADQCWQYMTNSLAAGWYNLSIRLMLSLLSFHCYPVCACQDNVSNEKG